MRSSVFNMLQTQSNRRFCVSQGTLQSGAEWQASSVQSILCLQTDQICSSRELTWRHYGKRAFSPCSWDSSIGDLFCSRVETETLFVYQVVSCKLICMCSLSYIRLCIYVFAVLDFVLFNNHWQCKGATCGELQKALETTIIIFILLLIIDFFIFYILFLKIRNVPLTEVTSIAIDISIYRLTFHNNIHHWCRMNF